MRLGLRPGRRLDPRVFRWFAVGVPLAAVLVATACQGTGQAVDAAAASRSSQSPSASPTTSPKPTRVDPLATIQVCGLATAATDTTITLFNEEMATFEQAAASNDQATMVESAQAIDDQFVSVAQTFTELAKRPVDPALRQVLTDISSALTAMTAVSYTGTTVDIRMKLQVDFPLALQHTCASASASPPVG
ncbi:MAG TPA: hypothetical protein VH561_12840 [Micromonosporaceae bacterium]